MSLQPNLNQSKEMSISSETLVLFFDLLYTRNLVLLWFSPAIGELLVMKLLGILSNPMKMRRARVQRSYHMMRITKKSTVRIMRMWQRINLKRRRLLPRSMIRYVKRRERLWKL